MDALLRRLQDALRDRYAVEHELGRGGMAVVFLGKDLRLDRRVAIKVFERDADLGAHSERFLREIRVAAQLQHPNILPVFESGEVEGLVYYVMPYVAGASLRERLEREGPLPIADAVRIAREVAEALDHAHRAGIVHRDIKPDNIMLADGVAVVADFGIARALVESGATITETGLALGTPLYMSPEQAAAGPVDARTDIYALGCVLYEMLAGSPPFDGKTPQIVMARHATDAAPPLGTVRVLPSGLEAIVARALAKLPADRWATGRAMAEALTATVSTSTHPAVAPRPRWTRLAGAAAAVAVLAASALTLWRATGGSLINGVSAAESDASVAVLPLSYSGDSTHAVLEGLLRDGLLDGLVRVEGLRIPDIRSRNGLTAHDDPREAGRALDVKHVLTASIFVVGNRVRIEPRLVNVADGAVLWGHPFDGELSVTQDLFNVTDSIAVEIVRALLPTLSPERRRAAARGVRTRQPEALGLLAKAKAMPDLATRAEREQQVALLEKAVVIDSTFADAWAALAKAKYRLGTLSDTPPAEQSRELRRLVARALQIDPAHAQALMLQARFRWVFDWDWDNALADAERAARIAPSSPEVVDQYAWLLTYTMKNDSALALTQRTLDPKNAVSLWTLAARLQYAGRRDSAIATAERSLRIDSAFFGAREVLLFEYLRAGRRADADRFAQAFAPLADSGVTAAIGLLSTYYFVTNNIDGSKRLLRQLLAVTKTSYVSPTVLAQVRLNAGDREGAIADLQMAARTYDNRLPVWFPEVYWRLRGDPRVDSIKAKVYRNRPVPPDQYALR